MQTDWVNLSVADGTSMAAFSACEPVAPAGGILLLQEAFGVNAHIQDVAQRLAREGYWALAPDLFHRTAPRFLGSGDDFRSALPHMKAMTREGTAADLRAGFDWLRSRQLEEIVAIGFCMGGRASVLAAQTLPLRAAASFYASNLPSLRDGVVQTRAPLLLVWGDRDEHIPRSQRDEFANLLRAARKPFAECTFSEAGHAFFNDQRPGYAPAAASAAWALALAFLRAT